MFTKTAATAVAITFALAVSAEALSLGGGLGGRSTSSKRSGGVSAGASVGRGGVSAGASVGGVSAGASVGRGGISAGASVGSAASVGASVSGSGVSTSTSVGGLGVDTSISGAGISATAGAVDANGVAVDPEQPAAIAAAGTGPFLFIPLPPALQPDSRCIKDGECPVRSVRLQEGRASVTGDSVQTGLLGNRRTARRLPQMPGTPANIVTACQHAAARAAKPYGAVTVEAASGGRLAGTTGGGIVAPVNLRVTYPGSARQAKISCTINRKGVVTGLKA